MNCPYCSQETKDIKFCDFCGRPLSDPPEKKGEDADAPSPSPVDITPF
jgi:hypothetical protein